jgi:hypothetical protein
VAEGELLEIVLTAGDPDGDGLSYEVSGLPEGASFIDNGDGTASFSWTPEPGQAGNYPVTFSVTDDGMESLGDEEEIVITVTAATDQAMTLCSSLGDDPKRWRLDVDEFHFNGTKGEMVIVTLDKAAVGTHDGERATLVLIDHIHRVNLLRIDSTRLPNQIKVKLPATGLYRVGVVEQSRFAPGKNFTGSYCLTVESSEDAYKTLRATGSVE